MFYSASVRALTLWYPVFETPLQVRSARKNVKTGLMQCTIGRMVIRSHLLLLLFWVYSVLNLPTATAKRPWSFPSTVRHGSTTHRTNLDVVPPSNIPTNDEFHTVLSSTNSLIASLANANATASNTSEYVVVCILGTNFNNTVAHNSVACTLIELIPSNQSIVAIKQQQQQQQQKSILRYHYYPDLLKNTSSSSEALSIVWRSVALLSDVIVINVDVTNDDDDNVMNNHDMDLVRALILGLEQRHSAKLSPSCINIIISTSDTTNYERGYRLYHELQSATTSDIVHSIKIIHGSKPDSTINNQNTNVLIDIPIPQPKEDGSHTLIDCSSFIHVLHETFIRLGYSALNPKNSLNSLTNFGDVIIIDSMSLTGTPTSNMKPSTDSDEIDGRAMHHPPWKFPKLSFVRKPKISHIPLMRFLTSIIPQNIMKSSTTYNINEFQSDDLLLDLDRMYQLLLDIQDQQEDYVLSLVDGQNVVAFDLVPMMNPIIDQLHTILSRNRRMASESLSMFDPIYQQLETIYEYQCNTILRNYYGTLYEAIFDQQSLSSLNAKWIHSLQERMRENYRRDVEQILRSLERRNKVFMSFSKKQQRSSISLDINKIVTNFMSDVQNITELRMDVSVMDDDDSSHMMLNDILHPRQYKNRLRRQRLYQWSKNMMKRVVMIGINYVQGYIAIQSIKYIALQQEREMPKFPLF